jgi:dTDP-4-amino-4,6-dideoxygalactose transaminase
VATGINGKMNEFNAALGLLQLQHIDAALAKRRLIDEAYRHGLAGIPGITCLGDAGESQRNYAYFPILVDSAYPISRDALNDWLKKNAIHPRRYFYPLISEFPMYRGLPSAGRALLPVATKASQEILCLPIYPDLDMAIVARVIALIGQPPGRG